MIKDDDLDKRLQAEDEGKSASAEELSDDELEDVAGGVTWHRKDDSAWDRKPWDETRGKRWNTSA